MKNRTVLALTMGIITSTIVIITLVVLVAKGTGQNKQNIDITMQIERLAEGDSIVVSNLVYPHVFESIKLQLQTPKKLISGDEKIKFGINEYDWLAHTIGDINYLKEFAMEHEDHLIHYKISFREEDVELTSGIYSVEFMTITRY